MNLIRSLYFISTIVEVAKSSAEADNGSVLAQSLSESKHIVGGSGSNDEKETGNKEETSSFNQIAKRMLEAGTKRLLQLIPINMGCCEEEYEEIFTATDGIVEDYFGTSCSISDELVVIGATGVNGGGAAYLFHLDGTEVAKLTPGNDGEDNHYFGRSVSIDEKVVVGTGYYGGYVEVFSRQGIYERTIRCDDCNYFGRYVATLGNLIVTNGVQNSTEEDSMLKLFIYGTEGELLKVLDQVDIWIDDVAISEQFIASTFQNGKTIIYSNTSPDFPKIAEIEQGGFEVAVSNDRIVIGYHEVAYLYKTDGTLVKILYGPETSWWMCSYFGRNVAITDDKVIVGAEHDDDQGFYSGSVFVYSAVTGECIKKVVAPDAEAKDEFGSSVCASGSHYVVGAVGADNETGAAYLFQFSDEE